MVQLPLLVDGDESQAYESQVDQCVEAMEVESSAAPTELDTQSDGEPFAGAVRGVGELLGLDDELEDDRMNGSMMPSGALEEELRGPPPRVRPLRFSVPDVLAMQPIRLRSPGVLPAGDGLLAIAGMMHSITTGSGSLGVGDDGIDSIDSIMAMETNNAKASGHKSRDALMPAACVPELSYARTTL